MIYESKEVDEMVNVLTNKVIELSYKLAKERFITAGLIIGVTVAVIYLKRKNKEQLNMKNEEEA